MITVEVPLFGTYQADNDLYQAALLLDRDVLLDRVRSVVDRDEYFNTAIHLLHCELAAMVAEWETGARTNEREAEKAALHVRPVAAADPTKTTVALNVSELSPRMRTALLNTRPDDRLDGQDLSGTIVALINRGMVEAGGDGRHLPLTEGGRNARARLERLRDADGGQTPEVERAARVDGGYTQARGRLGHHPEPEARPPAYAFGVLETAVQRYLDERAAPNDPGDRQLRRSLDYARECLRLYQEG